MATLTNPQEYLFLCHVNGALTKGKLQYMTISLPTVHSNPQHFRDLLTLAQP